jgi:hypothetical protein
MVVLPLGESKEKGSSSAGATGALSMGGKNFTIPEAAILLQQTFKSMVDHSGAPR